MSKRTLFLIFALFIIAFVLLMIALYTPSPKPSLPTPTASPIQEPFAQTTLSFGNSSVAASSVSSLSYSIPIDITTGKNKVTAIQLELQYDPEVLTNVAVSPGWFFKNPIILLNQIDKETGRISYAFGISPVEQGVAGQGTSAILTFDVKAGVPQQTNILFLPKTLVTAEGISQSVLKQASSSDITVGEKPVNPVSGVDISEDF